MTAEEEEGVKGKRSCLPIVLGVLAVLLVFGTACGKKVYDGCPKKADGSLECSNQDLSGERLRELDFSGADFSGANLKGADFKEADLRNAHLSGLDLSEEDMFQGADLSGANLSGANLSGSDLRDVNFSGANLRGADLRGADFSGGWRPVANLSGADLRDANLSGADFSGASLKGANLAGVDLSGLDLSKSDLTGADLKGVTADTDTAWPEGFDSKVAGVTVTTTTTTTTTTIQPLPGGFKIPPGDVIDRDVTLINYGRDEINIKVRNSGTKSAYYCILMDYELNDDDTINKNSLLIFQGLGSWLDVTYGTDYAIPPDGKERVLILEKRLDWDGLMFSKYVGRFRYKIRKFEKLSSPC